MASMVEDLVERAEEQRRLGQSAACVRALRAALDGIADDASRKRLSARKRALRAVAAYQLATVLLQDPATAAEGDALVWRLGFRLRLSDAVLRYDAAGGGGGGGGGGGPRYVDGALGRDALAACGALFGRGAPFWAHHGYPTSEFFSYNVPLDSRTVVGDLLRALRPHARGAEGATSGEVWAHAREGGDGAHQLHYDLDEAALRAGGGVAAPKASSVFYLETASDAGGGAPTLVVDRVLGGESDDPAGARGWLCFPRANRLLTFDGRLLHCVVPSIGSKPAADPARRRITVMVGWWGGGTEVTLHGASGRGPNVPLDPAAAWLPPRRVAPAAAGAGAAVERRCAAVDRVWRRVPPMPMKERRAARGAFGDFASEDVAFTGRFFLRESPTEIDDAVLAGAGPAPDEPAAPVEFVDLADLAAKPAAPAAPTVEYVDLADLAAAAPPRKRAKKRAGRS